MVVSHPPGTVDQVGSGRWNPWGDLKKRRHIDLSIERLPDSMGGAVYALWPDGDAQIALDDRLDFVGRRCAVAHEMVHDERGGVLDARDATPEWRVVARREERTVEKIVARRMVPVDELRALASARADAGLTLDAWEVAEEFEVTDEVAALALLLLQSPPAGWGEIVA